MQVLAQHKGCVWCRSEPTKPVLPCMLSQAFPTYRDLIQERTTMLKKQWTPCLLFLVAQVSWAQTPPTAGGQMQQVPPSPTRPDTWNLDLTTLLEKAPRGRLLKTIHGKPHIRIFRCAKAHWGMTRRTVRPPKPAARRAPAGWRERRRSPRVLGVQERAAARPLTKPLWMPLPASAKLVRAARRRLTAN